MRSCIWLLILLNTLLTYGCSEEPASEKNKDPTLEDINPLFQRLSPKETNIYFANQIADTGIHSINNYIYAYNGGGVAIFDMDNDGLEDILFTGNSNRCKLYKNNGDLQFTDVSDASKISSIQGWATGVTTADVNNDGWLDVYICLSGMDSLNRANKLFLNQQNGTFKEVAEQWRVANESPSSQAEFFDADGDGDLDMYLVNHFTDKDNIFNLRYYTDERVINKDHIDRLYRNDGEYFTDVTPTSGLQVKYRYGLSSSVSDINNDGRPDILITNDFFEPDVVYINEGGMRFSDSTAYYLSKSSLFSMGSCFADIDNDGDMDLSTMDMRPATQLTFKKNNFAFAPLGLYEFFERYFPIYQSSKNMLLLKDDKGRYVDVTEFAGIGGTEWSWSVLMQDYDNDGLVDIFISNGLKRAINEQDHIKDLEGIAQDKGFTAEEQRLTNELPPDNARNFAFKNLGGLKFEDVSQEWKINEAVACQGAAYADLDNDGDMDLVVNATDTISFIYENKKNTDKAHFAEIILDNDKVSIRSSISSRITLFACGEKLTREISSTVGFYSSSSKRAHFGLGACTSIDSAYITWPDGEQTFVGSLPIDSIITISRFNLKPASTTSSQSINWLNSYTIGQHNESDHSDFRKDRLLPFRISREGPGMTIVNGGTPRLVVGGAKGSPSQLFSLDASGKWVLDQELGGADLLEAETNTIDQADLNGDSLSEVYFGNGSNEFLADDDALLDIIYSEQANGTFKRSLHTSSKQATGVVAFGDIDNDGDLDVFSGTRYKIGEYPSAPSSQLLINNEGELSIDNTNSKLFRGLGNITDAAWVDIDNDGWNDLVIVGEWMPVTIFKNIKGKLEAWDLGLSQLKGWWRSVLVADINQDGLKDLICGNYGENSFLKASTKEPIELYYSDFDNSGTKEPIIYHYYNGERAVLPDRSLLVEQMPSYQDKFLTYASYAKASLDGSLIPTDLLEKAEYSTVNHLSSTAFLNNGDHFTAKKLSHYAQLSPINDMVLSDINEDGLPDLLIAGNDNNTFYTEGEVDAITNCLLLWNKEEQNWIKGDIGLYNKEVGRKIITVFNPVLNRKEYIIANNNGSIKVYYLPSKP